MQIVHPTLNRKFTVPDFFLLGAAKSGTSSLYYYLQEHPQVFMPRIKEPWFFSFIDDPPEPIEKHSLPGVISDVDEYCALYDDAMEGALPGDASPSYLYTFEKTIAHFRTFYHREEDWKRLKMVISLRNPIDRAWSQYWTLRRVLREPVDFDEAIQPETIQKRKELGWNPFYDYIGFGRYTEQVNAYFEAFGRDRVLVVLYDDLRKDRRAVCRKIFEFLEIDPEFEPNVRTTYNVSGKPKSDLLMRALLGRNIFKTIFRQFVSYEKRMKLKLFIASKLLRRVYLSDAQREILKGIYADEIKSLGHLLDRDLGAWMK